MRIQYLKHPATPHWSHDPMLVLGEDRFGVWLGATPGTRFLRPDPEDPTGVPLRDFMADRPLVQLVPRQGWWTLVHNPGASIPWYVDIVTPPVFGNDVITMVDLDLDVLRDPAGTVSLDDEDEFDDHRVRLGYPASWVGAARAEAARIHVALEAGTDPFGPTATEWATQLASHATWR